MTAEFVFPEIVKAKKIGLTSTKTGLPFVVWLLQPSAAPDSDRLLIQTSPGKVYGTDVTTFQIEPWFRWLAGPNTWLDRALLWHWLLANKPVVAALWSRSVNDPAEIASAVSSLPVEVVAHLRFQASQIAALTQH